MPIPEASFRRASRAALALLFLASSLGLSSCQEGGAFGMGAAGLAELLAGRDPKPVLALDEAALEETGAFGPAAYYYLGRWLDSLEAPTAPALAAELDARTRLLYRRAYDQAAGLLRRESGLALIARLGEASLWEELVSFTGDYAARVKAEWRSERPRLDALDALGRDAEAAALVARLASAYPAESSREADALAYFGAAADLRSGGSSWAKALRRLLLDRPLSPWSDRAYALVFLDLRVEGIFSPEELHALAMRDAVRRKEYGQAYEEALLGGAAAMGAGASQSMIADAGKAFLYSGRLKEGAAKFAAAGWTARFYKARFARELERWKEAAELFKKLVADAPTRADAEASRWYAIDCAYRGALAAAAQGPAGSNAAAKKAARETAEKAARAAALGDLVAASGAWRDSSPFLDLVNALYRDALRARDWRLIAAMAERLGPKLAPEPAARITYTSARALELGLAPGERSAAAPQFAALAANAASPLHYRALAAWRAGANRSFLPPPPGAPAGAAASPAAAAAPASEAEALIAGFAEFGLADLALSELRSRRAELGDEALRRLALLLSSLGRPDAAIRLEQELSWRPGFAPGRSDTELLYPRPFIDEIRALSLDPPLDEKLALGLIRSESLFRADAVSWAGAIGLSQLMPPTAAETAKALRLENYDLKLPKDNLAIGLEHLSSLLARTEGRPLRALMAYNAGWSRLKTWSAESGDLPDDLMIEALGIEETRQYCRNILAATVIYGELYYGASPNQTVKELMGSTGSP